MAHRSNAALLLAVTVSLGAGTERLTLRVGDTHVIDTGTAVELVVSRRGVVDVYPVTSSAFELTAMRRGLVIVEGRDPTTGEPMPPRYLVAVVDDQDDDSGQPSVPAVTLTADERTARERTLTTALGPDHTVSVGEHGAVTIEATCAPLTPAVRREHLLARLASLAPPNVLHLVCAEHRTGETYEVTAKIVATSTMSGTSIGGRDDPQVALHAGTTRNGFSWQVSPTLTAAATAAKGEVIGEPVLRVAAGETIEVTSGTEFQVLPHADGHTTTEARVAHWRQQGLMLKLGVQHALNAVRVRYDLSLRAQPGSGQASQEAHHLAGSLPLVLGAPTLAGTIDVRSAAETARWTAGLASIPIIGPLWRLTGTDAGATKLQLWLTVRRPD